MEAGPRVLFSESLYGTFPMPVSALANQLVAKLW